jgi:serine/threonine protein kinase
MDVKSRITARSRVGSVVATTRARTASACWRPDTNSEKPLYRTGIISDKTSNGSITDYRMMNSLGKGAYAEVKLAVHRATNKKYAIKIYDR